MAKFKVGDRVKILSGGYPDTGAEDGAISFITDVYADGDVRIAGHEAGSPGEPRNWYFTAREFEMAEPATPTEHPALTLAKAEVVRIQALKDIGWSDGIRLDVYTRILRAFGLRYAPKPMVPQPVEYEFVSIEPLRQES